MTVSSKILGGDEATYIAYIAYVDRIVSIVVRGLINVTITV